MSLDKVELLAQIKAHFPSVEESIPADPKFVRGGNEPWLSVPTPTVYQVSEYLRNYLKFDLLNMITAIDFVKDGKIDIVYQFFRTSSPEDQLFLRLSVPRDGNPVVPSLAALYASADWQERETYDLFGVKFEGHPNLSRILLWEGYPGWPLRKDYVHTPDKYDNGSEIGLPKTPASPHK